MIFVLAGLTGLTLAVLAGVVVAFLVTLNRLAEAQQAERRELYQRIQAPEVATAQAIDIEPQGFVSPNDDEGFWEDYMARAVTSG